MTHDLIPSRDHLTQTIGTRWKIQHWDLLYPWWLRPAPVRILFYADGSVQFNGGSFLGLQYVKTLLESRAYPYVRFSVDTAHRQGDPSATIAGAKKLTDIDLSLYDEIWFFGITSTPALDPAEVTAITTFMAGAAANGKQGGVLVTGDHANLGRGIAGQIPRAGQMRLYPAPDSVSPTWNTTLEDGPDAGTAFNFSDQSDDKPQTIRWKRYRLAFHSVMRRRYRPHPVLCGPNGVIDVLPDHQHEGEAIAPIPAAGDLQWPSKAGHQERAEVIAWGRIKDPAASKHGQEIGVISAYNGHQVDHGRVLADSTWHHWFDINLTGIAPAPSPYAGFDATAAGLAALQKIDAYFLNTAVWLAGPGKQQQMRNWGWWSTVWSNEIVELARESSIWHIGEQALSVLGKRAPQCTISEWIFDLPIFREKIPRWEWPQLLDKLRLSDLPVAELLAGGIVRELHNDLGAGREDRRFPSKAPEVGEIERAIDLGTRAGLSELSTWIRSEAESLQAIAKSKWF